MQTNANQTNENRAMTAMSHLQNILEYLSLTMMHLGKTAFKRRYANKEKRNLDGNSG
jgi:hypothetical protein